MSAKKAGRAFLPERGLAWIAAFLLTALLTVFLLSAFAVQAMTSARLHLQSATSSGVVNGQVDSIREYIDLLAKEYDFSAEEVKATVSRDELEAYNRSAAEWLTRLLTEGQSEAVPRWYSADLENAVYSAMSGQKAEDANTVVTELSRKIDRMVFPLRETVLATGLNIANSKADLPGIIRTVRKLPLLGLGLSFLAAGMIALLMGREITRSMKYYGTALAGTGFTVIAAWIVILFLRLNTEAAEASAVLGQEIGSMAGILALESGIVTLFLLAGGYLCLHLYRKKKWEKA